MTTPPSGTLVSLPPDLAIVAVDTTELRGDSSVNGSVVEQITYGTELHILDQGADWFKVKLPDQREGWIAADGVVIAAR